MGYLQRAKSMHDRGQAVRAAILLAEGLKRDHQNAEALEWLLHLYVEEIPNPGMEKALLRVLDMQSNGLELFEIIEAELREMGRDAKVDALHEVRGLEGYLCEPPPPQEPPETQHYAREPAPPPERYEHASEPDARDSSELWREELESQRAAPRDDRWEAFENPLAPRAPRRDPDPERDERGDRRGVDARDPRGGDPRRFDDFDDLHRQGTSESPAWVRFAGLAILLAAVVLMVVSIVSSASDDDAGGGDVPPDSQDSLHQPQQPVESAPPEPEPEPEYEPPPVQDDIVIDEDETDQLEMEGSG